MLLFCEDYFVSRDFVCWFWCALGPFLFMRVLLCWGHVFMRAWVHVFFLNFIGQGEVVETEIPDEVSLPALDGGNESNGTISKMHDRLSHLGF